MARPKKDGLDYFPHDCDMSNDLKMEAIEAHHGLEGYAVVNKLLERIYKEKTCELDISDADTRRILARKFGLPVENFESIVATAARVGFFCAQTYQNGVLTSGGIHKRAQVVLETRKRKQERYEAYQQTREARQDKTQEAIKRNVDYAANFFSKDKQ